MRRIKRLTPEEIFSSNGAFCYGIMDINGRELYVETYGQYGKPAIAFLHGGPATSCVEQQEMSVLLSERYFVVSFDQYGVFRSGDILPGERFGMKEHIEQMEQLREALKLPKWTLLGHSYGGMLVCNYTYRYPDSIEASIYENPGFNFPENVKTIAQYYLDQYYSKHPDETAGMALAQSILEKDYSGRERECIADILKAQSYVKDIKVTMYMYSIEPDDYFHWFKECYASLDADEDEVDAKGIVHLDKLVEAGDMLIDHTPEIAVNQAPALLINGRYDPVCVESIREYFITHAPKGKLVLLENSAHHPRIEQREEYLKAVFDFLEENGIK